MGRRRPRSVCGLEEVAEGALWLIGLQRVVRETVRYLIGTPRVQRLQRRADGGVESPPMGGKQLVVHDSTDAAMREVEALVGDAHESPAHQFLHALRRLGGAERSRPFEQIEA